MPLAGEMSTACVPDWGYNNRMEKDGKPRPSREEVRRARQAEALRANLQRRKQQVREREDASKRHGGPAGSGPVSRK